MTEINTMIKKFVEMPSIRFRDLSHKIQYMLEILQSVEDRVKISILVIENTIKWFQVRLNRSRQGNSLPRSPALDSLNAIMRYLDMAHNNLLRISELIIDYVYEVNILPYSNDPVSNDPVSTLQLITEIVNKIQLAVTLNDINAPFCINVNKAIQELRTFQY